MSVRIQTHHGCSELTLAHRLGPVVAHTHGKLFLGVPAAEQEQCAREIWCLGESQEKPNDDKVLEVFGRCGARADSSPECDKGRKVDARSNPRQDQVGGDLPEDVTDEQDRDGDVELVPLETKVGLKALNSSRAEVQKCTCRSRH